MDRKMPKTSERYQQAELKQVVTDACTTKALWTTDWAGVQLQRCRFHPSDRASSGHSFTGMRSGAKAYAQRKMWVEVSIQRRFFDNVWTGVNHKQLARERRTQRLLSIKATK